MLKNGTLGNAIRTARINKGVTQEELAEVVDITVTHLKHIESEHRKPSIEVLFKIVTELEISLDSLLFEMTEDKKIFQDVQIALSHCTEKELKLIIEIVSSIKRNR